MLKDIMTEHFNRDSADDPIKVIKTSGVIYTASLMHKLSYDQLPGGALIVADRDIAHDIWCACDKPKMLDTLSFCKDKMHFELLHRPPVIIFVTSANVESIRTALFSKTGFSKSTEFTAYYLEQCDGYVQKLRNLIGF
ncbi:hypothetical protein Aes012_111 [Aeromonas phage Aes012]|uniref:Putative phage protein n=1 Tax=Aeromonas phage Aes012 TaxID=1198014 RepID=I6YMG4_9CAUD|nr:hypothetical protein Aes012_111 [Aeromonas phage Aes012]AFN69741.1 putative phage protein [Aeromonas phage Aes012]